MEGSQPFIGLIQPWPINFEPQGWAFCDGRLLPIAENDALFALIGTTYGGDGVSTFGLPDLRSRVPIHTGQGPGLNNVLLGEMAGTENISLTQNQMPSHNHQMAATTTEGNSISPTNNIKANSGSTDNEFAASGTSVSMANNIGSTGDSQPIDIRQPYLGLNYIISLFGIFPTQ